MATFSPLDEAFESPSGALGDLQYDPYTVKPRHPNEIGLEERGVGLEPEPPSQFMGGKPQEDFPSRFAGEPSPPGTPSVNDYGRTGHFQHLDDLHDIENRPPSPSPGRHRDPDLNRIERLNRWDNFSYLADEGLTDARVGSRIEQLQKLSGAITTESQFVSRGPLAMLPFGDQLDEAHNWSMRELGYKVQNSAFVQRGPLQPLVSFAGHLLEPQSNTFLALMDQSAPERVQRKLRDSDLPQGYASELLEDFSRLTVGTERMMAYEYIEDAAVASVMLRHAGYEGDELTSAVRSIVDRKRGGSLGDADVDALETELKGIETGVRGVLDRVAEVRGQNRDLMKDGSRHHIRNYDGEGRDLMEVMDETGGLNMVPKPLYASQTADVTTMVDLGLIRQALGGVSSRALQSKAWWSTIDTADRFTRYWKIGHLLRPAWMTRTILLDEQFRVLAKLGTFTNVLTNGTYWKGLATGGHNYLTDMASVGAFGAMAQKIGRIPLGPQGVRKGRERLDGEFDYDWLRASDLRAGPAGFTWLGGQKAIRHPDGFTVGGYKIDAFYTKGDISEIFEQKISSKASMSRFLGRDEIDRLGDVRRTGVWKSKQRGDVGYFEDAAHVLNRQVGQDAITRPMLEAHLNNLRVGNVEEALDPITEAKKFLDTDEGRAYMANVPWREGDDSWLHHVNDHIRDYTQGREELIDAALGGHVTPQMLEGIDEYTPIVHGEVFDQLLGRSAITKTIKDFVDINMTRIGTMSSDRLMRQPFAQSLYKEQMTTRVERMLASKSHRGLGESLTQKELDQMMDLSRRQVVAEVQGTLYDFANGSRLQELMRFVMPFYGAWEEAITAWAQLAVQRPDFIAQMAKVWTSPNRNAGMVEVDEFGEEWIVVPFPEQARQLPWLKDFLADQTEFKIKKQQLNMIFEGPGFGTFVALPVSEIARERPDIEQAIKFVLPYGAQQWWEHVTPTAFKRLAAMQQKEQDRGYAMAMTRFYQIETIRFNQGDRDTAPTHEEIQDKTNKYYMFRLAAGAILPAHPNMPSPYQALLETMQNYQDIDPIGADERFLEEFGEDFFVLTQGVTKT
ncbi:MAG: hypothetical protein M3Q75_01280, partial [Gemmatimonadota bacterium]|nr:hypothetical protein [Gemmatimonadota bacterium]